MVRPPVADIRRAIRLALQEDFPLDDITTSALFPSPAPALARIVAQQSLIVAGLAGAAIPLGLAKTRFDPAIASGVFLTTVTDVVAFLAFLGLGALFLL